MVRGIGGSKHRCPSIGVRSDRGDGSDDDGSDDDGSDDDGSDDDGSDDDGSDDDGSDDDGSDDVLPGNCYVGRFLLRRWRA